MSNKIISFENLKQYNTLLDKEIANIKQKIDDGFTYNVNYAESNEIGGAALKAIGDDNGENIAEHFDNIEKCTMTTLGYQKKNLLKSTVVDQTKSGITLTVNSDNSIVLNGTQTNQSSTIYIHIGTFTAPFDGAYIISGYPDEDTSVNIDLGYFQYGGTVIRTLEHEFTMNKGESLTLMLCVKAGSTLNNRVFKPMIRYANIADNTYEPYIDDVDTRISQINSKIEDYKDSVATTTTNGLMSSTDKIKIDGIEDGANKYILPTASSTLGGVKTTSTILSSSGLIPTPIIDGVPYYNNTTYSEFVKSGSGAKAGLVPKPSTTAGTTKYLREDGKWEVPPDNNTTYLGGSGISIGTDKTINHTNSVTAATASGSNTKTLSFGGTFDIPTVSYDSEGHITGKGITTMSMPSHPIQGKIINANYKTAFRTQTKGNSEKGAYLAALRNNTSNVDAAPQYGSGIAFGCSDTHGYLYTSYLSPVAYIGGGGGDQLSWTAKISLDGHTHNYLSLDGGTVNGDIIANSFKSSSTNLVASGELLADTINAENEESPKTVSITINNLNNYSSLFLEFGNEGEGFIQGYIPINYLISSSNNYIYLLSNVYEYEAGSYWSKIKATSNSLIIQTPQYDASHYYQGFSSKIKYKIFKM